MERPEKLEIRAFLKNKSDNINFDIGRISINPHDLFPKMEDDIISSEYDKILDIALKAFIQEKHNLTKINYDRIKITNKPIIEYKDLDYKEFKIEVEYEIPYHPSIHHDRKRKATIEYPSEQEWYNVIKE